VAAVAKEQEAFAAEQQQRVLAQQQAEGAQRLQSIAIQVEIRGEDAQQLQQRVSGRYGTAKPCDGRIWCDLLCDLLCSPEAVWGHSCKH
jgi:hypothetical protein